MNRRIFIFLAATLLFSAGLSSLLGRSASAQEQGPRVETRIEITEQITEEITEEFTEEITPSPSPRAWGGGHADSRFLHGFRLGYTYLGGDEENERLDIRSSHAFLFGYEASLRLIGDSWLDVILTANVMIAGLEQSEFLPSGNFIVGFEIDRSLQIGAGINLTHDRDKISHMILAAGWTPWAGGFYVPVHVFFVPDIDGSHRAGVTVGITL